MGELATACTRAGAGVGSHQRGGRVGLGEHGLQRALEFEKRGEARRRLRDAPGDFIYTISDGAITVHETATPGVVVDSELLPGYTPDDYYWWW